MRPKTITLTGTGARYFPVNFHMDPPFYGIQVTVSATAGAQPVRVESTIASPWAVATATTGSGFPSTAVWNSVTGFSTLVTSTQGTQTYYTVSYPVSAFAFTATAFQTGANVIVTILPIGIRN